MTDKPDPSKVKVQLNTQITWEFMAHLDEIARKTRIPKSVLVREALEEKYPLPVSGVRNATRDAGATR
jgi:predicted transcriptional regulator